MIYMFSSRVKCIDDVDEKTFPEWHFQQLSDLSVYWTRLVIYFDEMGK